MHPFLVLLTTSSAILAQDTVGLAELQAQLCAKPAAEVQPPLDSLTGEWEFIPELSLSDTSPHEIGVIDLAAREPLPLPGLLERRCETCLVGRYEGPLDVFSDNPPGRNVTLAYDEGRITGDIGKGDIAGGASDAGAVVFCASVRGDSIVGVWWREYFAPGPWGIFSLRRPH